ncbi:bifunctional nuclease family protein [bacterium]|nr:MAG: bifunctional nuclease family protein [bacterium]
MDKGFVEVTIHGLTMDPNNNNPVILLKQKDGQKVMPIWIGLFEANSIAMSLGGVDVPRPMTHDLLRSVLEESGLTVEKVAVTELKDNTFYATIFLRSNDSQIQVDSRPSDAIALAVRSQCPIFIMDSIFTQSSIDLDSIEVTREESGDKWLDLLENMDPEDFSKYKM